MTDVRELSPEEILAVSGGTNTWDSETDTSTAESEPPVEIDTEYWT